MAEALLRHHLHATALPLHVSSAGILGWNSSGATDHTLTALAERGILLEGHISRKISFDLIDDAALVLTMTNDHADAIRLRRPQAAPRTWVLGQLVRLGERHRSEGRPRREQDFDAWLASIDPLRDSRRRALPRDEIRDPLGEPLPAYRELAAHLDDLTARLSALIAVSR